MLSGDFFTISAMDVEEGSIKAVLELNPDHHIFSGHFPGMPVVPGVCMMQIVHEIVEKFTGKPMLLSKADQMKFLVVVDPRVKKILNIDLLCKVSEDGTINAGASISADSVICFKFKGSFIQRETGNM